MYVLSCIEGIFLFNTADPHVWSLLQKRFERPSQVGIADIYDGEGYRQYLEFLSSSAHISLILNTVDHQVPQFGQFGLW